MAAEENLKLALKVEKFRWKNLVNEANGKRSQMMELARPKGEAADALPPFENPRGVQVGQEPVTFRSGILIQVSDNPEEVGIQQNT